MPRPHSGRRRFGRVSLLFVAAALALGAFAPSSSADTPPPIPANANWQTTVNFYRAMAGLAGVTENTSWSAGAVNHSRYMAENDVATHNEDPGNPYYTPDGDAAGQNGNVALFFGFPSVSCPDRAVVELWMAGPYHAIGIVDPRLATSGFGKYISQNNNPGTRCGGTLDVLRGRSAPAPSAAVFYPGHGTTTPLLSYNGGEFPDPLATCPGYSTPTGPAILLQLPTPPGAWTVTLKDNNVVVPSCSFGSDPILTTRNAIAIMPRNPLVSGHTYAVDVQIGATHHIWSFSACAAGQNGGSCNVPTAATLRWATAVQTRAGVVVRWRTASEAEMLGFNVYRAAPGRLVKLNKTLIPSIFGGTARGHGYVWLDRSATRGTVTYRLEAVRLDGSRTWLARAAVQ